LMAEHRERRVVKVCQQIRVFARRSVRPHFANFTYFVEIDALCKLGKFSTAWRQLRRWERVACGKNLDLMADAWAPAELNWFFHYHPQLLYFLGRYRPACHMLEALLEKLVTRRRKGMSYEVLWHVYNPIAQPRDRHEVTLYHLYQKLGKNLQDWPHWERFVKNFHPKLFGLTGVRKEDLLRNPSLLRQFFKAITDEQKQRLTANVSVGERDLIDLPGKIRHYQETVAHKMARLDVAIARSKSEQRLEEMFPELQHLGR